MFCFTMWPRLFVERHSKGIGRCVFYLFFLLLSFTDIVARVSYCRSSSSWSHMCADASKSSLERTFQMHFPALACILCSFSSFLSLSLSLCSLACLAWPTFKMLVHVNALHLHTWHYTRLDFLQKKNSLHFSVHFVSSEIFIEPTKHFDSFYCFV